MALGKSDAAPGGRKEDSRSAVPRWARNLSALALVAAFLGVALLLGSSAVGDNPQGGGVNVNGGTVTLGSTTLVSTSAVGDSPSGGGVIVYGGTVTLGKLWLGDATELPPNGNDSRSSRHHCA